MANETIELLKNWTPNKMQFPASWTEKFDGVPLLFSKGHSGFTRGLTRQGETCRSLDLWHPIYRAIDRLLDRGEFIVGEVWHPTAPFKDISGWVRQHGTAPSSLILKIFDGGLNEWENQTWVCRILAIEERIKHRYNVPHVQVVERRTVYNAEEAASHHEDLIMRSLTSEGSVIHSHSKLWSPGKRCWGTQRIKDVATIDLPVVSVEEAISGEGEPKAMAGRINCLYKGLEIGVGPGAMDHQERISIWNSRSDYVGRIAEVKYMPDPTYNALRQPTFVRWRDDKNV